MITHGTDTVEGSLNTLRLNDYVALRLYEGAQTSVYITKSGIAGNFVRNDSDTTSVDNGGTTIVSGNGKRWKRVFSGAVNVEWFGADPTGTTVSSSAIQSAINAYKNIYAVGTFLIDTPINITSDVNVYGEKRKTTFKKTSLTTNVVTRTYTDSNGVVQTLTWDQPVVFNLICPNESYLTDFNIINCSFDLPSDGSVGVFHGQRVCYSSFESLFCNYSKFFIKGFDMWQIEWVKIRSRFSKDHFNINTGTSNGFKNVAVDGKSSAGGTGYTFTNLNYSSMTSCSADSVDRCYYFDNSVISMTGCGAESFSRIVQAVNGAEVTVVGGALIIYKVGSAPGSYFPYQFSDAGTRVTFTNTWLGIANPGNAGGTYGQLSASTGATVILDNIRKPVEIGGTNWWYVSDANSLLTIRDESGTRYINRYGTSRYDGVSNIKNFVYTKSLTGGSAQSVIRIDNSSYGSNCFGKITVMLLNSYNPDIGFVGAQTYQFACYKEATASQTISKIGDATAVSNTGGSALGTITATMIRNGDNTVDLQLNIPSAYGTTTATVLVEYMNNIGSNPASEVITGL